MGRGPQERALSLRCAYCHDGVSDLDVACSRCRTLLHGECARSLEECPTLGCGAPLQLPPPPVAELASAAAGTLVGLITDLAVAAVVGAACVAVLLTMATRLLQTF